MEEIKIKKSNFKIVLFSILGIIILVIALNMFLNPSEYVSFLFKNKLFIKIIGLIGFILLSITVILIIVKYFRNSFGLIIDKKGIFDNSSVTSVGLIEWKDIKGIRESNIMSTQFLIIDIYDNQKYLKKPRNVFISMLLKTNIKTYNTPIIISNKSLKCSFDELRNVVNEQYKLYTNKTN